jgi:Beta-propeller repeat
MVGADRPGYSALDRRREVGGAVSVSPGKAWTWLAASLVLLTATTCGTIAPLSSDPVAGSLERVMPLPSPSPVFVANRGRFDHEVVHYMDGPDATVFFTSSGLTFALDGWALKLDFVGARHVVPVGGEPASEMVSDLRGPRRGWQAGLPAYRALTYSDLWPGIDLLYSTGSGSLKYEFVVHPGADPERIDLSYRGATSTTVRHDGALLVQTPAGSLLDAPPVTYQLRAGGRVDVAASYRMKASDRVGFDLGDYDPSVPLVIDPEVMVYGTFLGGSHYDSVSDVAIDAAGNAYVVGSTLSRDFPVTPGAYDVTFARERDVFVSKLSSDGSALVYSTYLGGRDDDYGSGVAVDGEGHAHIVGGTYSLDFPITPNAFDTQRSDFEGFVAKLSPDGSDLFYSSFLGGSDEDNPAGIGVDATGVAYVAGATSSNDFPVTAGAFDETYQGGEVFVSKVDATGSALLASTFLGGREYEVATDLALGGGGEPIITGYSTSDDFPTTPGAFDRTGDGNDAIVAKLAPGLGGLRFSTYLGGNATESGSGIDVDRRGNVFVAGRTDSLNFPLTPNAFDTEVDAQDDGFVTALDPAGATLVYSSYLGGGGFDYAFGIAIDARGRAAVIGDTSSSDFPVTPGAFDRTQSGTWDGYVALVNPDGSAILAATFLGGAKGEFAADVAVDARGFIYAVGATKSQHFPVTPGAFDTTDEDGAEQDGYIVKFDPTG